MIDYLALFNGLNDTETVSKHIFSHKYITTHGVDGRFCLENILYTFRKPNHIMAASNENEKKLNKVSISIIALGEVYKKKKLLKIRSRENYTKPHIGVKHYTVVERRITRAETTTNI